MKEEMFRTVRDRCKGELFSDVKPPERRRKWAESLFDVAFRMGYLAKILKWNSGIPKEDGWYWLSRVGSKPTIVYVSDFKQRGASTPDRLFRDGYGALSEALEGDRFMGPLKPDGVAE